MEVSNPATIQPGATFELRGPGGVTPVSCRDVEQRNWSRVGPGQLADGAPIFLKQFADRRGEWHADHYRYEEQGTDLAARVLGSTVRVPRVLLRSEEHMVLGIEWVDVVPLDELLRSDESELRRIFPSVLDGMSAVLDALRATPESVTADLPVKSRDYTTRGLALNFKGLDIRNVSVRSEGGGHGLVVFDYGRPYLAPIEEAAAKVLISVGLLNWGKPAGRFLRGPDADLLRAALERFADYVSPAALAAELDLQRRFRFNEFLGSGRIETFVKTAGVRTMGARYMRALEHLCGTRR